MGAVAIEQGQAFLEENKKGPGVVVLTTDYNMKSSKKVQVKAESYRSGKMPL
jgi:hypothetical protein